MSASKVGQSRNARASLDLGDTRLSLINYDTNDRKNEKDFYSDDSDPPKSNGS